MKYVDKTLKMINELSMKFTRTQLLILAGSNTIKCFTDEVEGLLMFKTKEIDTGFKIGGVPVLEVKGKACSDILRVVTIPYIDTYSISNKALIKMLDKDN